MKARHARRVGAPHALALVVVVLATLVAGRTAITRRATNERDVIWSGACSSGVSKTKTCTFTLGATATATANVQ